MAKDFPDIYVTERSGVIWHYQEDGTYLSSDGEVKTPPFWTDIGLVTDPIPLFVPMDDMRTRVTENSVSQVPSDEFSDENDFEEEDSDEHMFVTEYTLDADPRSRQILEKEKKRIRREKAQLELEDLLPARGGAEDGKSPSQSPTLAQGGDSPVPVPKDL